MAFFLKITTLILLLVGGANVEKIKDYRAISDGSLTVNNLSKKWKLDKYRYFIFSEKPAENERDDFIHLKSDMTFDSVSEGIREDGKWRLNASRKRIYLSKEGKAEEFVFIVESLSSDELILIIDDPSDGDAKNLKIYFKNLKK